jgi:hypothetical protein
MSRRAYRLIGKWRFSALVAGYPFHSISVEACIRFSAFVAAKSAERLKSRQLQFGLKLTF